MKKYSLLLALVLALLGTNQARAGVSPLGLSLIPPVQLPPESFTIAGVRLNALWGNHIKVYGFDIGGLGNMTGHTMNGIQAAGGFNYNRGEITAVFTQLAGLANINTGKATVYGVQVAGIVNKNDGESRVIGLSLAPVNLTAHTKIGGIQVGLYNRAQEVFGFQIGVINEVDDLHGLQIGLLNFNNKGLFAVAPFLNVGF